MTNELNRRSALGSLATAGALLAVPGLARAAGDDADVYAAIKHVMVLKRAQEAARDRLDAAEDRLPVRQSLPALIAQRGDREIFKTEKLEGAVLNVFDVEAARSVAEALKTCGIASGNSVFGAALSRISAIEQANGHFLRLWAEAMNTSGYKEVEKAYNCAANAVDDAAEALLDLTPQTVAGLRAIVVTLKEVGYFDFQQDAEDLGKFLLEAPALGGEA